MKHLSILMIKTYEAREGKKEVSMMLPNTSTKESILIIVCIGFSDEHFHHEVSIQEKFCDLTLTSPLLDSCLS